MEFLDKMIFLLVISFLTSLQSEKVLSKWKNCGDQECATAMSRVQANKDYTGPDCRYLNFKVGEEIIVYSKLSRKQTDLWVGSKGKDFGYFPKDAVKVDEVFITQEVEVPTKETDFLCLDGGEYSFENKDSLLYEHDEDNEYSLPYTNQKELESKELKVELQKHASFLWDHEVELDPANVEADRTSEDLHMQEETTSNEMSRKDKSGNDDAVHPEAQSIHPSAPTQATWTVSSVARWLNLGSKHDEETTEIVSQSVEENTFRSRKIAVADESDLKELNEEDEPKPMTSGWFQSGLTDFLYFSRESIGHDLPPDENDPHTHHSSSMAGHSDHEFIAAATETSMDEEQQQSDKEDSDSSWFNLGLPDVLTFGHAKKDKTIINEEQSSEAEDTTDKTGKMQSSNQQETEFHKDRELKKQPYETTDEKQTDKKNVVEGIIDSDSKTPSSGELPTNRDTLLDFKSTSDLKETSSAGEVAERNKLIEPYSSEQDSVSESQVLKNTEVKERTQESENKNGQSGWYKNIYSNFINLNKDLSDNNQDHESVVVQSTQQSVPSWISSFPSSLQSLDPIATKNSERKKDERYKGLQPLLSFSYFTNILNFQSSATEVEEYVQPAQEDLSFSEEHPQTKNSDKILQVSKETSEKLQANQKVSERVQEKRDVDMSQESVWLSPLSVQGNGKIIHYAELEKDDDTSALLFVESQLEPPVSQVPFIQHFKHLKSERDVSTISEKEECSNIKSNYDVPVLEDQQHASSELNRKNTIDLPLCECSSENFYSSELYVVSKEESTERKEAKTYKKEEMHTLNVQEPEICTERKPKREIAETAQQEGQNDIKTEDMEDEMPRSRELQVHVDNSQNFKIPSKDELPLTLAISDKAKLTEVYNAEQNPAAESQVIGNTEVKEKMQESENKKDQPASFDSISNGITDFNLKMLNDQEDQEPTISEEAQALVGARLFFSSSSLYDTDRSDIRISEEEKPERFEEPQSLFSVSHYKNILSSQSFTSKDKHFLQRLPGELYFNGKNSQSRKDYEISLENKESEEEAQSNQKVNDQVPEKSNVDNSKEKDILLLQLAVKKDRQNSESTMKETKLVKDCLVLSSAEYRSEHNVDFFFRYPKCEQHSTMGCESEPFSIKKDNTDISVLEDQHQVSLGSKINIEDAPEQHVSFMEKSSNEENSKKKEKQDYLSENISEANCHKLGSNHVADTKSIKTIKNAGQLSLQFNELILKNNLKHKVQEHYIVDSEEEGEHADVKYNENPEKGLYNVSQDLVKNIFSRDSNDDSILLKETAVNREDVNWFSQDRVKQPKTFTEHIAESSEDKLETTEQILENNKPNKQKSEKRENRMANQEQSLVNFSGESLKSENITPEQDSHTLNDLLYNFQNKDNKGLQTSVLFPREKIDEDTNERNGISNPSEHDFDNSRITEDSLSENILCDQVLHDQIIAPDFSFSEEGLKSSHKKDPVEIALADSSFQHELLMSKCESEENTNSDPKKKCKNQLLHNKRQDSSISSNVEVSAFTSPNHNEDTENINTENESEDQKIPSDSHSDDNVASKLLDISELKISKQNVVTTETSRSYRLSHMEHKHLFQEHYSIAEESESSSPALHLESFKSFKMQSQTVFKNHDDSDSNKPFSPTSPYYDSAHNPVKHAPLQSEQGLDTLHLNIALNNKTYVEKEDAIPTKTTSHIEKLAASEKPSIYKENYKKDTESQTNIESINIDNKNSAQTEEVVDSICTRTSWFFGGLFSKTNNHNSGRNTKYNFVQDSNENRKDIRINKKKKELKNMLKNEDELRENESEQDRDSIQTAEATRKLNSRDPLTMLKERAEKELRGTEESGIAADLRNNEKETDNTITWERESVSQKIKKDDQILIDSDSDVSNSFTAYQQFYLKLSLERKKPSESLCESETLMLLEQQFEKIHHGITTYTCVDNFRERKPLTLSVEEEPHLDIVGEKCLKEKVNILLELQEHWSAVRVKCSLQNAQQDISNKIQLLEESKEKHRINTPLNNENNNAQSSEGITIPLMKTKDDSSRNIQLGAKKLFTEMSFLIRNYIPSDEEGWIYQILLRLNALDIGDFIKSVFSVMATVSRKVVAALPEDMRPGPDLYGFSWEMVICAAVIGIFTVFLFLCRSFQSVKSRFYVGREKQLANKVAELVEEKCEVLEKLSLHKKEYEDLELSLKNANLKESTDTTCIEETYEKLNRSNLVLKHEIENLEKELEKEKSKRSEQDEMITEIERRIESLEDEAKSIQTQVAEANTTLKVFHINTERLKTSVQDAVEENYHLQESEKQLLQEAEGWGERFSELNEQTKMFESSKADMEEALKNKESQVKSLTECLLKMKDWSSAIREDDATEDSHWDTDTKGVTENGEHLDDQQKRTVKKLIYAAKLNACLKTLETERNQVYSKLDDENKAKEELAERIENLQSEQVSLQSENVQFESEVQKLQQKLKVMTELYQENEMKLHRRLTVEERERLQKEEKLSKVDEKINHAAEELNSYRQRAKDLEEELEKTIRSYQSQITSHEKKAHDNWLTARAAERHLNDIRKENAHSRQKLTETEFKVELLEKDPFALDVPVRPFGREHSPYGPSPMGRPSSETRAFLSPPTLLEGPLRLSPILPGGGGRGSRGPGNPAMYEGANERGELISDRLSDPHRPPSDTGSLSPPWDRDRRIILPPTGQPYNDPALPPRRPERFYSSPPNSGRLSGPAELRSYNLQPFDKPDGQASSENSSRMESSGNGTKDHPNLSNLLNVSNQSLASESEAAGSGFAVPPIPQIRAPLIPVDPRGPFIRRGPPFPPPPPPPGGIYGPREYFPMRDFAGLPRPPLAMRSPFPPRPFSQYPPQRAGFFSPPSLPLENRNELTSGLTHQLNAPATEHPEPQQET